MARARGGALYLGIKGHVIAVDRATGEERWRTKLTGVTMRTSDFVHLVRDGDLLVAAYNGEVYCLDPKSGEVRWHNKLSKLGTGLVSIVGEGGRGADDATLTLFAEKQRQDAAAAATAGAGA